MDEYLIESVRDRELLYNNTLIDYRNHSKKQKAWEEIAAELNSTAGECKTKWNLLRNAFIHAISRRKSAAGKKFQKWKFEDEMAFLVPYLQNRNPIATRVEELHENSPSPETVIVEESSCSNSQRTIRHYEDSEEMMMSPVMERYQRRSEKNDIELFFASIAETVKTFPKIEQVKMKSKIMSLVNEVEMRMCLEDDD